MNLTDMIEKDFTAYFYIHYVVMISFKKIIKPSLYASDTKLVPRTFAWVSFYSMAKMCTRFKFHWICMRHVDPIKFPGATPNKSNSFTDNPGTSWIDISTELHQHLLHFTKLLLFRQSEELYIIKELSQIFWQFSLFLKLFTKEEA